MEVFVTFLLNLIYISATLALIALGLAMVFGLLGVMNMAHGEFVMLGAYSVYVCLLYTSPSPRDRTRSRMPSSA